MKITLLLVLIFAPLLFRSVFKRYLKTQFRSDLHEILYMGGVYALLATLLGPIIAANVHTLGLTKNTLAFHGFILAASIYTLTILYITYREVRVPKTSTPESEKWSKR